MKYLKMYEKYEHKHKVNDIVRYVKTFVHDENNVEKEKLYFIKKVYRNRSFGNWYDIKNVYEDEFGIIKYVLSEHELELVKISDEQAIKVKIDIEANKYNI